MDNPLQFPTVLSSILSSGPSASFPAQLCFILPLSLTEFANIHSLEHWVEQVVLLHRTASLGGIGRGVLSHLEAGELLLPPNAPPDQAYRAGGLLPALLLPGSMCGCSSHCDSSHHSSHWSSHIVGVCGWCWRVWITRAAHMSHLPGPGACLTPPSPPPQGSTGTGCPPLTGHNQRWTIK